MFIRRLKDCDEFVAGDGSILREFLHPDKIDVEIRYSLAHAKVARGEKTKPHRLKTAEVYYILAGRGRMHIDEEVSEVSAECAIYIPPQSLQYIENTGPTDLVFLCIVDPAWKEADEEVVKEDSGARIATDVVLLPDEAMTQLAIDVNKRLTGDHRTEIMLSKEDCLPHISLAMGGIDEADIGAIRAALQRLAGETAVRQLEIVGILSFTNSRGETVSVLEVARTGELQALHERVMKQMEPFFRHDVTEDMIHDDVVAPTTLDWIRNYPDKASFDRYAPHITIGYGQPGLDLHFPIPFHITRLALCHLGNHCTCRKVLTSADLM